MSFIAILNTYYFLALVAFVWMVWRYKSSSFLLLMLCVGFEGTLTYCIPGLTPQIMRIIYVIWAIYLFVRKKAWSVFKGPMLYTLWAFFAFSVYFIWVSLYLNDDTFLITFSQYSIFFVPFVIMLIFASYHSKNPAYTIYFNKFFGEFLIIQIISGIVKYVLFQFHYWEGMVGTFGDIAGGGAGTSFPLVALAWVLVNTNMEIKGWKSWLFVLGLLIIGIATGKRAVIILYPAFYLLFALYVAKHRYRRGVVMTIALLVPVLFYIGLRLTPSLNPERKVWGSFDPEYALNYAEDYSLGVENKAGDRGKGNGRIGADILIFHRMIDIDNYTPESWFGYGLKRIFAHDASKYSDRKYNFGINHRGSMTGFVRVYLSIGLIGLLLFMLYYWTYFILAKYWRLRVSLYSLVMFDFIFYNWMTIHEPLLSILLIFVMYYSQIQYTPSGKFIGQTHPFFK